MPRPQPRMPNKGPNDMDMSGDPNMGEYPAMGGDMPPEGDLQPPPDPMDADPDMVEEGSEEKYSAQLIRRIHQDLLALMEMYDGLLQHSEHQDINKFVVKFLEGIDVTLTGLEGLMTKHHPDSGPLEGGEEGGMEDEGMEGENAMGGDPGMDMEEEAVLADPEIDDIEADPDAQLETDSFDEDAEEVTPEDAIEGMNLEDDERRGPGGKGLMRRKSTKLDVDMPMKFDQNVTVNSAIGSGKTGAGIKHPANSIPAKKGRAGRSSLVSGADSIGNVSKSLLQEAVKFLGDTSESATDGFGEPQRKHAYYLFKAFEGISDANNGITPLKTDPNSEIKDLEEIKALHKDHETACSECGASPCKCGKGVKTLLSKIGKRKAVRYASKFLQELSNTKAFGEEHRTASKMWKKILETTIRDKEMDVDGQPLTGEMASLNGAKSLKEAVVKNMETKRSVIADLTDKLNRLSGKPSANGSSIWNGIVRTDMSMGSFKALMIDNMGNLAYEGPPRGVREESLKDAKNWLNNRGMTHPDLIEV